MCAGLEHYTWKNASLCDPPCRWRYCSFASTSSDSWRLPAEGAFHGGFSLLLIVRASVWTSTGICDESWCACVRVCVSVAFPFICFVDCLCSEPSSFFLDWAPTSREIGSSFFFLFPSFEHYLMQLRQPLVLWSVRTTTHCLRVVIHASCQASYSLSGTCNTSALYICVCVCRPSSLDSTLYVYFTRGKNILKTGKESSDLHLERCYTLYGVTLPDNSNFDN